METLAERIARDGPVNELDAIGWAIRLAKRIEALHQLGVAHGSVSPACILTAGQDRNARAYLADVQHTTPTPAYQSPERILGGDISTADDVWALASTLYALLTGQSPFAGVNDGEVRQKILAASPAPLAVFDVGDDDLQHILDRSFAREMGARTSNISAFRRALEEWHPDRGVANLPPLEDEDSTYDDDDVARTVMVRDASAYMAQKLNIQVPNQPQQQPPQQMGGPPSPRLGPPQPGHPQMGGPPSPRLGPPQLGHPQLGGPPQPQLGHPQLGGPPSPRLGPPQPQLGHPQLGGPPSPRLGPQPPQLGPPHLGGPSSARFGGPQLGPPQLGGPPSPRLGPQPPQQGPPPQVPLPNAQVPDDEDDDNVRTVMRSMPQDDLASIIARATAAGAPGAPPPQAPAPFPMAPPAGPGAPAPGRPVPAPASPFGRPGSAPGFPGQPPPYAGPPSAPQQQPYGGPPSAPQPPSGSGPRPVPAPVAPPYAFGGRPAPGPAPPVNDHDDDDEDDNARTMMRSPEQYLAGLDGPPPGPGPGAAPAPAPPAPAPFQPARPGPLGPPGARSTSLGGFQGAIPGPPPQGPPQPVFAQPSPPAAQGQPSPYGRAPEPPPQQQQQGPAPGVPWGPVQDGPPPAATVAFPAYDGGPAYPDPRLGGGTNPMGMPDPRLGGGTQPMGGPNMEAAMAALAAHRQSMSGAGGPPQQAPVGGPTPPGGVGLMAAPGDLSALEGPMPGQQMQPGGPPGMPGQFPGAPLAVAPAPARGGKGLLIAAAIVALLIAAGLTFVFLRTRAG